VKTDIILAGVGGQGILSIASVIGYAAIENNLYLKQSEVHGMSQRGGAVESHLRLSSNPVASDLIPYASAQIILSVEPMESLRYLPWLAPDGRLITNSLPFVNIKNYPDIEQIYEQIKLVPSHLLINADELAKNVGSAKASNMVLLGAAAHFIDIPFPYFEAGIQHLFGRKGKEIVDLNIKALHAGRQIAQA
jgi:indolepyruvate ferredoxin oxidoreductase, beta subunit